ncbi:MAG: peptidoglycan DD-metalloendopeptidase family protein [Myxococcales bacterium]|nr:peptidoglycan DD-metalloendopeptidase family protein [Myxococcales bacterium]
MARFPFRVRPTEPYSGPNGGMRRFGSARSGGRLHAGCDLYGPVGTPIVAVADGTVLLAPYLFYDDTYALEVHHPGFGVVRYGEILPPGHYKSWQKSLAAGREKAGLADASAAIAAPTLKAGTKVTEGEVIAAVGRLASLKMSMLHFELYDEAARGQSLSGSGKFKRNKLLVDPTQKLLDLEKKTFDARDCTPAGTRPLATSATAAAGGATLGSAAAAGAGAAGTDICRW